MTLYFAAHTGPVAAALSVSTSWVQSLGISLSFYLDGLSLLRVVPGFAAVSTLTVSLALPEFLAALERKEDRGRNLVAYVTDSYTMSAMLPKTIKSPRPFLETATAARIRGKIKYYQVL